ncbi:MAG: glycosyltransferase [Cuniculiplasma sp.]
MNFLREGNHIRTIGEIPIQIPKFAIVILVYNHVPDIKSILKGKSYAERIILVNNNSSKKVSQELTLIAGIIGEKCLLLECPNNMGVSRGYNYAVKNLDGTDVDYIFFFDHDAVFGSMLFTETFSALKSIKNDGVGVIVPIVSDDPSIMGLSLGITDKYSLIHSTITSGIFIRKELFIKVGGFDENIFVEGADYELTRRIVKMGYSLLRINRILIVQEFEQSISSPNLLISFFNLLIRYRSLIRVKLNNCNIYRTKLSYYNGSREKELFGNLNRLRKTNKQDSLLLSTVIFLNCVEISLVKIINKIKGA